MYTIKHDLPDTTQWLDERLKALLQCVIYF